MAQSGVCGCGSHVCEWVWQSGVRVCGSKVCVGVAVRCVFGSQVCGCGSQGVAQSIMYADVLYVVIIRPGLILMCTLINMTIPSGTEVLLSLFRYSMISEV